MPSLNPEHLADLQKSGLTDETIRTAGIYTVPPDEIGKKLGGNDSGILSLLSFPYPGNEGHERFKCWYQEGKSGPKYRQRKDAPNRLYLFSTVDLHGKSPLLIVEGEKKALALNQAGIPAVGIGGVWNRCMNAEGGYRQPKETKPIPDLALVNWRRPLTILFDSDGHDKPLVRLAAFRLGRELSRRGASVSILFLPPGTNGEKQGADDFLVAHGPEALTDLLKTAWPFDPNDDRTAEINWLLRDLTPDTPLPEKLRRLPALPHTLVRLSRVQAEEILLDLAARLKLPSKFLSALRKDTEQARKKTGKRQKKEAQEAVYTAMLPGLVDLVEHEGAPAFLLLTEAGLGIAAEWEHEGALYAPPPREQIPWLLSRGEEVLKWYTRKESPSVLYDDLLAYHKGISDLPAQGHYHLLTAWDFHTYMLEPCQYSPEICFFAVPERGKSRTGKGMIYVARRGVHVESLRDAYLVRLANNFQATIFFDVMSLWKKAEKAGSEDIILGRYERGVKVPRVLYPERGAYQDTVYYEIFGPTIIATNVAVHNILDTRAVQINMPQTDRRFEQDVTPEAALVLKERLTAFRAHHLGKPLPECYKPASGRLGDILKPLLQVIRLVKPDGEGVFMDFVRNLARDRLIDKGDSLEAQILLVLDSLRGQVSRGILPVKTITDAFNEGKPEGARVTYQRMGRKLNSLGFEKGKADDGASAILWDDEKFMRIFSAYGLGETSETSETPKDAPDISAQSDVTDVFSGACQEKKSSLFSGDEVDTLGGEI
ncbi:MAG: DUF3854 domain-containing protein [Desulfobaccales bacterium]